MNETRQNETFSTKRSSGAPRLGRAAQEYYDRVMNTKASQPAALHSGTGTWPDEPPRTAQIVFDELDDLPCPHDANPASWAKLPRELRASILRARAAHKAWLERKAAAGQLLPFDALRDEAPLRVEGKPGESGAPKRLLQLPLFAVVARGSRRKCDDELIHGPDGIELRYSGEQLDQEDLTVYMAVMNLYRARKCRDLNGVSLSFYTLLRELRRSSSNSTRAALLLRLRRLSAGRLTILIGASRWSGTLLTLYENEPKGRLWIQPSAAFQTFFLGAEWQRLEWGVRLALGHDQLALALWSYFRTFAHPFPIKIETLRERVGSVAVNLNAFRADVRVAMQKVSLTLLSEAAAPLKWEIDENDRLCVDWAKSKSASES